VLDTNLVQYLNPHGKEFYFLKTPVVQTIYNYQINYVLDFSKMWFKRTSLDMLDWSCGKGYVSYLLKNKNVNVSNCDVSISMAFATNSPIIFLANINVIELKHDYILPFDNSSFDAVLSFGVLEHMPNELESLLEIQRILKPNSLFFCFYLPYKLSYTQNIQHLRGQWYHKKLYWKNDIKKLLERSNMKLWAMWHRAIMPKISFISPSCRIAEKIDNWLCNYSLLKYFATNIEFVVNKNG
jgi:SAM-dependent methyltransferase